MEQASCTANALYTVGSLSGTSQVRKVHAKVLLNDRFSTWSSAVFDRRLRKNIVVRLSCSEPDSLQSLFAPLVRRGMSSIPCTLKRSYIE